MANGSFRLPTWVVIWFVLSFLVQIWDALFVLLRPHSMPGGSLAHYWGPYVTYCQVDKRYGTLEDDFVSAQSWLNLVEVTFGFIALGLHVINSPATILVAFAVSVASLAKTVLYFVSEYCSGFMYTGHNDVQTFLLLFFIPSFFWILFPFLVCVSTGRQLVKAVAATGKQKSA